MKWPINKLDSTSELSGFTLLEVLVTLVILAIGLLGLAGLQVTSLKYNLLAYHRSQATQLSYDIADRMRSNITAINNYTNDPTAARQTDSCNTTTACSPTIMAGNDLYEWNLMLKSALPSGLGAISFDDDGITLTISITWDDDRDGNADNNANFLASFQP